MWGADLRRSGPSLQIGWLRSQDLQILGIFRPRFRRCFFAGLWKKHKKTQPNHIIVWSKMIKNELLSWSSRLETPVWSFNGSISAVWRIYFPAVPRPYLPRLTWILRWSWISGCNLTDGAIDSEDFAEDHRLISATGVYVYIYVCMYVCIDV